MSFITRGMQASWFVASSLDAIRRPSVHAEAAAPLLQKFAADLNIQRLGDEDDIRFLVQTHAATTIVASLAFTAGKFTRLAALLMALLTTITTALAHPFWLQTDEEIKHNMRLDFFRNLSLLGGLFAAIVASGKKRGE